MWLGDTEAVKAFDEANRERAELTAAGFAADQVTACQTEKLDRLWDRLAEVPFYRDRPELAGRHLSHAPITPKATLKSDPWAFVRSGVGPYHRYYETSGTTGAPTPTPRLVVDMVWNAVSVAALWGRMLRPGSRVASLLPSDVVPVGDLIGAVTEYLGGTALRCYPFSQGICDWDRLDGLFSRYRPQHVFAAPGVLLQWTRLLKQRGRLSEVSAGVESLMLLGEVSTPALRYRLAQQWRARAQDGSYGSTETGTIAATCELDRLHLLLHSFIAEVVTQEAPEPVPVAPGRSGELVVTTLNSYARPLLRYATGDLVSVGAGADCACGLALPVLTVHGRSSDQVVVDGVTLAAEPLEQVVYTTPGVTGYMLQLKHADPTAIRIVLERDVDFTGDDRAVCDSVRERVGEQLGVRLTQVVMVGQLTQASKAGGSQKYWKRTNVQWVD
jgi:phenylacetate-CoA ligase